MEPKRKQKNDGKKERKKRFCFQVDRAMIAVINKGHGVSSSRKKRKEDFQSPPKEKDVYLNWLDPGGSAASLRPKRRQDEVPRGPSGDGGSRRADWAERSTTTS